MPISNNTANINEEAVVSSSSNLAPSNAVYSKERMDILKTKIVQLLDVYTESQLEQLYSVMVSEAKQNLEVIGFFKQILDEKAMENTLSDFNDLTQNAEAVAASSHMSQPLNKQQKSFSVSALKGSLNQTGIDAAEQKDIMRKYPDLVEFVDDNSNRIMQDSTPVNGDAAVAPSYSELSALIQKKLQTLQPLSTMAFEGNSNQENAPFFEGKYIKTKYPYLDEQFDENSNLVVENFIPVNEEAVAASSSSLSSFGLFQNNTAGLNDEPLEEAAVENMKSSVNVSK